MSGSSFQPEHDDQTDRPRCGPRRFTTSEIAYGSRREALELANLKADLAVKEREVRELDDRHDLADLKLEEQRLVNEGLETRLALTWISVVLIGALLVAGVAVTVMDPATRDLGGRLLLEAIEVGVSRLPVLSRG